VIASVASGANAKDIFHFSFVFSHLALGKITAKSPRIAKNAKPSKLRNGYKS
jgi:hypothetical protein